MGFALEALTSTAWAMLPETLEIMKALAARDDITALGLQDGQVLQKTRKPVELFGTVAVVNCTGPMFRYANLMTDMCGATSTEDLVKDLVAVADNPAVKNIILNFDTPGGEAKSLSEAADYITMIMNTTGKPITAYVDGQACSAGYWLASQCKEIVISKTGQVGSIGAVWGYSKPEKEDEKTHVEMVSSRSPNKRPDLTTDEGISVLQTQLDDLADVFIASAAQGRGMTEQALLDACNQGGVVLGAKAVAAGLADRTGNLQSLIAELNDQPIKTINQPTKKRGAKMSYKTVAEMQAAHPELCEQLASDVTAEAQATANAQAEQAGIEKERARTSAILNTENLGHVQLAHAAILSGAQPLEFQSSVLQAEAGNKNTMLAGAGNDAGNIKADADGQDEIDAAAKKKASAANLTPKQLTAKAHDYMATQKAEGHTVTFNAAVKLASQGAI